MQPVPIHNEDEAWALLEDLHSRDFSDDSRLPVITQWPRFHFKFWIAGSQLVLTQPVMQAMVDYQTSVNRAFMLLLENTPVLTGLSEEERKEFEVVFAVKRGSTDLSFNAQELIEKFMEKAVGKLSGKQITVMVIAFAVLFAGYSGWNTYLEHQNEVAKAETASQSMKDVLAAQKFADETDLKRMRILADALTAAHGSHALIEASDEGKKGIVRAAAKVQNTEIGGKMLPPEVARRMARAAPSAPVKKMVVAEYDVLRVDTDVPDGFRVRLKNTKTNQLVFASLRDALVSEEDRALIRRGEWEKKPIIAKVQETWRRGNLASARVEQVIDVVDNVRVASKH
ncbi:hypothetical protein C8J42_101189 [Sphingomonas sp. PP-CE-1A-559]|uniref:hypothetical protein n=1 Tax=Sphingomonas sp. PP-CE-1A-559 TaxID=2135657 RepID=UPI001055E58C|nr:hypothetical protein [Sphingomonas sp. PP-CE-1A-559]TCP93738.1 hypothetical protein C8J42_101189 [Sphingomonas sp. PP-CE-1A-559]